MSLKDRVRRPTGDPAWPFVLLAGEEKTGKSWAAAVATGDPRLGDAYWVDLGEGSQDEYGSLGNYWVVDPPNRESGWDYPAILAAVTEVHEEAVRAAAAGKPPVVLVFDSLTALWVLLSDQADAKARRKNKVSPDTEVVITTDLWNSAKRKWRAVITLLMTFPGVVIATARAEDVALMEGGKPVPGKTTWKVRGERNLPYDASVVVRLSRDGAPVIHGIRSVHVRVRPGVDRPVPMPDFTVAGLVFDVLRCGAGTTPRDMAPVSDRDEELDVERAAAARRELAAACDTAGVHRRDAAAAYQRLYGVPLPQDTDADRIREFGAKLTADPTIVEPDGPVGECGGGPWPVPSTDRPRTLIPGVHASGARGTYHSAPVPGGGVPWIGDSVTPPGVREGPLTAVRRK